LYLVLSDALSKSAGGAHEERNISETQNITICIFICFGSSLFCVEKG
jgi:hypothetical protein